MVRTIIKIDSERCNGCGLCIGSCHEAAIVLEDGRAKLLREDYCDGLGNCLPVCPVGAIAFEEREAAAYNEAAVKLHLDQANCSGACDFALEEKDVNEQKSVSQLRQWPVQIRLAPAQAPYFQQADLLVSADCCAYAHGDFHNQFMRDRITLVGCPKLDNVDYSIKLANIFQHNSLASITVLRMEVPCCSGMEQAVQHALARSGKQIPCRTIVLKIPGASSG